MGGRESFYELLGVDSDASEAAIERAYREHVKEYHPDVSDSPDARQRFKRINRARDVLCDRRERARYDRMGHEAYLARDRSGTTSRESTKDATDPDASAAGAAGAGSAGAATGGRTPGGATRSGAGGAAASEGSAAASRSSGGSGSAESSRSASASQSTGASRSADTARSSGRSRSAETTRGAAGAGRAAAAATAPGGARASRSPRGARTGHDAGDSTDATAGEPPRTPGRFALREAAATVALAAVAAGAVGLSLAVEGRLPAGVGGEVVLLAAWLVVATLAGLLAAAADARLPDDVVRAQALPLVLLVGAWYVGLGTDRRTVALGLVAYAAHATVFRTAALVADPERSAAWPMAVWFLGTAPAAVLVYATRLAPDGAAGLVGAPIVALAANAFGAEWSLVVAVSFPLGVSVAHAFWRLWRSVR